MKSFSLGPCILVLLFLVGYSLEAEVKSCKPSLEAEVKSCKPNGSVRGRKPIAGLCDGEYNCCLEGKLYPTYKCSPPVSGKTKAVLTLTSFQSGVASYGPTGCDDKYHSDEMLVVALSTGWYNNGGRCLNNITVSGNGHMVNAIVVDECDSTMGCTEDYDYQPPCANNQVDASKAVRKALGVPEDEWDKLYISWSDNSN